MSRVKHEKRRLNRVNNFLWATFTRFKHYGCDGPLIIDARLKPRHAPPLTEDPKVTARVDELGKKRRAAAWDYLMTPFILILTLSPGLAWLFAPFLEAECWAFQLRYFKSQSSLNAINVFSISL